MRLGVIGAGGFIGRTHIRAAVEVPGLDIVAYVDPGARADQPELQGMQAFPDLIALLAADIVDGVVVAVPDEYHVPVALQCLEAGAAVLLEKPAATSLRECLELAAGPEVETRLLVAHQRRHHPASAVVKELLASAQFGTLLAVSGVFALKKDDNYFLERPRGVGLTNLIHDLDLLQYFCGRIETVSAAVSHRGRLAPQEDTIAAVFGFATGSVGTMVATDYSPSPWGWDQSTLELPSIPYTAAGTTYSLMGTGASVSVPDLRLYHHRDGEAWHHDLIQDRLAVPAGNAYVNQLAHFVEVASGVATPRVSVHDAVATQAALDAVFLAHSSGRRVETAEVIESART